MKADLILDPTLRRGFERDGFAVTPLLDAQDIAEVSAVYQSVPSGMSTGFYTTLWSEDLDYRRAVRNVVTKVLSRRLKGILGRGRFILTQLAVKQAGGGDSTCPMHSDWSFVDESIHQPISFWIPLIDITPEVGPLKVVPGSHRVFRRIRPNQPREFHYGPFDEILPLLEETRAREILISAGTAILYDGAIVHGSRGNQSSKDRVSVVAVYVPEDAPLYHYWQSHPNWVEVFEVDEEFLTSEVEWGKPPTNRRRIEILDLPPRETPITLDRFDSEVAASTAVHPTISGVDPWRTVSLDGVIQSELDHLGSSKVLALAADQVAELREFYETHAVRFSSGFHADMFSSDLSYRQAVYEGIARTLNPVVDSILPGYEINIANYIVKEAGAESSEVGLHQDWSIVDATRHRSVNIFVPLTDVNIENGCLHVLDGSHRTWRRGPGPFHALLSHEVSQEEWGKAMRPVPMKAGEVLLYDSRLLHSSPSNRSPNKRLAIGIVCAPKGAQLRFYHKQHVDRGTSLEVWSVDRGFFQRLNVSQPEEPLMKVGTIDFRDAPYTAKEISGWLSASRKRDEEFVRPSAFQELTTATSESNSMINRQAASVRRIFHDETLEAKFRHQGYVVVPFLNDQEVKALYEFFHTNSPPNIAGFHGTMYHNDREYRVRIDEFVRPMLQQATTRWLVNYRCIMCNFMVKEPGEAASEMPLHQDWSFVREPELRSVHIWCPAVDVDHENGNLAVVPGTQHFSDDVRAFADVIPFQEQLDLLRERYTRELPMKAGEAVLFDGRLVHSSPPNMSSSRRITAQAIGIPNESPIYHSWRCSPTQVEMFEVPDAFFFDYVLHQRPQGVEPVEVIEYAAVQRTAEELSALEKYQEELQVR